MADPKARGDGDNLHGLRPTVYDLPQLYTKPSPTTLIDVLNSLAIAPSSFSSGSGRAPRTSHYVEPAGLTRYLTSIISSPLSWVEDEATREQIWDVASTRISERSGRTAMPTMSRIFNVAENIEITLHEPSMTGDNLGFKTWTSSLLLARRLKSLSSYLPAETPRVLELGAGTGLVGIAAACVWKTQVTLTDLPEIVPNLQINVAQNQESVTALGGTTSTMALDWSDSTLVPENPSQRFPIIVAADPLYSPDHPKMLVETVMRWLSKTSDARFIIELPLRGGYDQERSELKARLKQAGLHVLAGGEEIGYDDWKDSDGQLEEVKCWWAVWHFARVGP